jgi:hypothetical protein
MRFRFAARAFRAAENWLLGTVLLLFSVCVSAAPVSKLPYEFTQPDGSRVSVRLFGDEFYIRAESLDGYTLVRDEETGWICYAELDEAGGALISTKIPYLGGDFPLSIEKADALIQDAATRISGFRGELVARKLRSLGQQKHIQLPLDAFLAQVDDNFQKLFPGADGGATVVLGAEGLSVGPPAPPPLAALPTTTGTVRVLSLVIDFSDEPASATLDEYRDMLDNPEWHNNRSPFSVAKYYAEVSNGLLLVEHEVFGVFRAPRTFAEYDRMEYGAGAMEILEMALNEVGRGL